MTAVILLLSTALAQSTTTLKVPPLSEHKKDGPHGGHIIKSDQVKMEVQVKEDQVKVYDLSEYKKKPNRKTKVLFVMPAESTGGDSPGVVEVQAAHVPGPDPHYQGAVSPANASQMGFEIRIK